MTRPKPKSTPLGDKRKRVCFGLAPYTVASKKKRSVKMCILKVIQYDFETSKVIQYDFETSTRVCRSFYLALLLDGSLGGASDGFRAHARRTRNHLVAPLTRTVATTLKIHIILIVSRVLIRGILQTSAPDRHQRPQSPMSENRGGSFRNGTSTQWRQGRSALLKCELKDVQHDFETCIQRKNYGSDAVASLLSDSRACLHFQTSCGRPL